MVSPDDHPKLPASLLTLPVELRLKIYTSVLLSPLTHLTTYAQNLTTEICVPLLPRGTHWSALLQTSAQTRSDCQHHTLYSSLLNVEISDDNGTTWLALTPSQIELLGWLRLEMNSGVCHEEEKARMKRIPNFGRRRRVGVVWFGGDRQKWGTMSFYRELDRGGERRWEAGLVRLGTVSWV
ncbi:hypothetical protein LTR62_004938 [Meristemomyces frigidus]|uniref:Uncharacterized protein n=1 Tax=Meristemomyces frigidus TaxID=1508187 RepID=A0AAN7YR52_9PEZI|nr:hypothetical protein LTR62_004938 [Meristemomyces frigidus]